MASSQASKPPPMAALQAPAQQALQRASTGGLRYPTSKKTIYDRNLNRSRTAELSRASFAYLFGEMVTYAQRRVTGIQDLEKRSVHSSPTSSRVDADLSPADSTSKGIRSDSDY